MAPPLVHPPIFARLMVVTCTAMRPNNEHCNNFKTSYPQF